MHKQLAILAGVILFGGGCPANGRAAEGTAGFQLATFSADVRVPLDHGMMGGAWLSRKIIDPLEAHGLMLLGPDKPVVFVAVDW